jgi:hypothetical protein
MGDDRDRVASERDRTADGRDVIADRRDADQLLLGNDPAHLTADVLDRLAEIRRSLNENAERRRANRARAARSIDRPNPGDEYDPWAEERREFAADDRQEQADHRDRLADERDALADERDALYTRTPRGSAISPIGVSVHGSRLDVDRDQRASAAQARLTDTIARQSADVERRASPRSWPLAAEFVKIGQALLSGDDIEQGMDAVVHAAVRFVNGCDAASFSALVEQVVTTIAASSPLANDLDQIQYRTSQGPCLEAMRTLQAVISDDLSRDERWPAFVADAARSVGSAMATPILDGRPMQPTFGSLNAYGRSARAFDQDDADTAVLLTAHLGVLLRLVATAQESNVRAAQLSDAVLSRDVIGQAKGILMARDHITAGEAFDVLRMASQRSTANCATSPKASPGVKFPPASDPRSAQRIAAQVDLLRNANATGLDSASADGRVTASYWYGDLTGTGLPPHPATGPTCGGTHHDRLGPTVESRRTRGSSARRRCSDRRGDPRDRSLRRV